MIITLDDLRRIVNDITEFTSGMSGLRLRKYQKRVACAIANSVHHHKGLTFVVIFPRQSGKNELQAQIETYLLTMVSLGSW